MRNTSGLKRGGPGRPRGVTEQSNARRRLAASALVDDPVYRDKLCLDLRARRVAPPIEQMLWFLVLLNCFVILIQTGL